jgi:hypothetical protein
MLIEMGWLMNIADRSTVARDPLWILMHQVERKAVPLQAWSGPEVSRKLRFSDFVTTEQDSGKFLSLNHRPHLPPGKSPGTHFC